MIFPLSDNSFVFYSPPIHLLIVCVHIRMCPSVCAEIREGFAEINSPKHLGTWGQTQEVRLGGKILHVLSHLVSIYLKITNIIFIYLLSIFI